MQKIFWVLFLAVFATVGADTVYTGGYTFDIDAVNRSFHRIRNARASVFVSGNTARVEVRADGYRTAHDTIWLTTGQKNYRKQVRMDDPQVIVTVKDDTGKVMNTYVNTNQIGAWDDEFQFEFVIREPGFTQFDGHDVDLRVNHTWPFGEFIDVWGSENNRQVRIRIKRRDMREFSNWIDVIIPRDKARMQFRTEKRRKILFEVQNNESDLTAEQLLELQGKAEKLK